MRAQLTVCPLTPILLVRTQTDLSILDIISLAPGLNVVKCYQTFRGAFPKQRPNSLINHHSTMHELASHDCFPNTVASPSFEPYFFNNMGPLLMTSHACGGGITSAI